MVTFPNLVSGITQTGAVDISLRSGKSYTLLASQASFGAYPNEKASNNEAHRLLTPPSDNALLCQNVTTSEGETPWNSPPAIILVPRGECTFELKAWNAQKLGAAGILVYGTLGSRYTLNTTKYMNQTDPEYTVDDIVYPQQFNDYDCNKGKAQIPSSVIQLEPLPYNSENNDPILSGDSDTNLCKVHSDDGLQQCDSKACLLTGNKKTNTMEACCAWDLHVWLYNDPTFDSELVTIPAAYLTMRQGQRLLKDLKNDQQVYATLYSRYRPDYNSSSILIWMLGVFVAALAAYLSASDYHRMIRRAIRKQEQRANRREIEQGSNQNEASRARSSSPRTKQISKTENRSTAMVQETPPAQEDGRHNQQPVQFDDSLELTSWHALGFVIMASSGLLILFFFKVSFFFSL